MFRQDTEQAGDYDELNPNDLIEYKVTAMPNFNMKDRGTAEAEEREELIKES